MVPPTNNARASVPVGFHVTVKPRGAVCNLGCKYCYFLRKEQLYTGSSLRMDLNLLEEYTRQYIQAQSIPEVTFAWQGGEPTLMGLDFFIEAVRLQQKHKKPGMRVHNTLQTNGIGLDDAWCRFFFNHNFLIGLSLDGPRDLHDAFRVDKSGRPTFDKVMQGLELLRQHCVEFNILASVHAANADHAVDVYRFLRDNAGSQFIQFIPIVERDNETGFQDGDLVTDRSVTAIQYGEFLIAVFDEWVKWDVGRVFVQTFDVSLAAWVGQRPGLCVFEETCGLALAMEHNGDLYSCDHYVEPKHKLGNILETPMVRLVGSEKQRSFGLVKKDSLPGCCWECEVRFVCNGGCPKDRITRAPNGEPGLNYLCDGYRAFFKHIDESMRFMAHEIRARRPPANIMNHLRKTERGGIDGVASPNLPEDAG